MKKNHPEDDFLLERLSTIISPIALMFGSRCEVVLHDLRQLERSIVAIENGHVTGRSIGNSLLSGRSNDKGLKLLKEGTKEDVLINYTSKSHDGKSLQSTTIIIRNKINRPIAALCINMDITDFVRVSSLINEMWKVDDRNENKVTLDEDLIEVVTTMINNEITNYYCSVRAMKKNDRLKIVMNLNSQGIFAAKNAVKLVANRLNVSKHAIYSYLDEIRSSSNNTNKIL